MLKYSLFLVFFICFIHVSDLNAQLKEDDKETDSLVLKKLEWFKNVKFGLMMHWGTYSQWGIVESWSLCSEDEPWCRRKIENYEEYKRQYKDLKKTFNPEMFDPDKWAEAAFYAGMKYIVFTTKHHDGFCMFDTKQTGYKITDEECPFHSNPKSNVTSEIFKAFRKKGFGTGVYFSKPDWNSDYYWWQRFATPDRNVNYDPGRYPDRWQKFKDFTYNQIEELMTDYGQIDILWLDGGWVRPKSTVKNIESKRVAEPYDQDIDMPKIAEMARQHQPGLIIVDRTVTGKYENYRTPEQHVPDKPLDYPWETCMTMASSWSYVPGDRYKPARRLIHLLIDIVAKGGNLLLNIGPGPNGEWAPDAYDRLREIGDWMKVNGEAIYETQPVKPYKETKICFTSKKDGSVYAIYLADKDEFNPPDKIMIYSHCPSESGKISMLGVGDKIKWEPAGKGVLIHIPDSVIKNPPCNYAWTFRINK